VKYVKILFVLILLVCGFEFAKAQVTFDRAILDNIGFSYSSGAAVQQTDDGGYIMAGTYRFLLGNEANSYLVKTNQYGDTLWTKVYRDRDSMEIATSVQQTTDGGYILCGWLRDFESGYSWYIRKTDDNGNIMWVKYFTGINGNSRAHCVIQTNDGGYAVTGHIDELAAALIKLDSGGNTMWTKQYYRNDADQVMQGFSLQQTSDNGYIIAGYTPDAWPYYYSAFLLKTDSIGNVQWNKAYNNIAGWAYSVSQTSDDGFILAGIAGDTLSISDILLIKTDTAGAIQWSKSIGSVGEEWAGEVNQTHDGGYILSGISNSFGTGGFNYNLTKTNNTGNIEWSKIYDEAAELTHLNVYPSIYCAKQVSDEGYICSGLFYSSSFGYTLCLIKTDSAGKANCNEISADPAVVDLVIPTTILPLITLTQIDTLDSRPYWVTGNGILYTQCLNLDVKEDEATDNDVSIFPNPTLYEFTIAIPSEWNRGEGTLIISISDISGREVYQSKIQNTRTIHIQSNLSSGIYNLKVSAGEKIFLKKLMIK
jgi:hypothetical protein